MDTLIQPQYLWPAHVNARQTDTNIPTLFQAALRDPSNLELDWLWLAAQLTGSSEQSFCFRQALRINPHSELARRGLAQLERRPGAPLDFTAWSQAAFRDS